MRPYLLLLFLILASCKPAPASSDSPSQPFTFYTAAGTEKIIPDLYDCADRAQIGLATRTPNITRADLTIRLTAPQNDMPAYQIGTVELILAANPAVTVSSLSHEQVTTIYTGKVRNWAEVGGDDAEIQVWAYGAGNELQAAFNETMLTAGTLSSNARQAQSPRAMREILLKSTNALGIIPHAEVGDELQILSALSAYPILVLASEEAENDLSSIIHCLQSD